MKRCRQRDQAGAADIIDDVIRAAWGAIIVVTLLHGVGACQIASPLRCDVDGDCPPGLRCHVEQHACVAAASVVDAGTTLDAGDAAFVDVTTDDLAVNDATPVDTSDAAILDRVAVDAEELDASDAATADASDAATPTPCDAGRICGLDVVVTPVFGAPPHVVTAARIVDHDGGAYAAVAALTLGADASVDDDAGATGQLEIAALTVAAEGTRSIGSLRSEADRRAPTTPSAGRFMLPSDNHAIAVAVGNEAPTEQNVGQITLGAPGAFIDDLPFLPAPLTTRAVLFDMNGDGDDEALVGTGDGATSLVIDWVLQRSTRDAAVTPVTALTLYCDPQSVEPWPPILVGKQDLIEIKRWVRDGPWRFLHCGALTVSGRPTWLAVAGFLGATGPDRCVAAMFATPSSARFALFTLSSSGACTQAAQTYMLAAVGDEVAVARGVSGTPAVARRAAAGDAVIAVTSDGTLLVIDAAGGVAELEEHTTGLSSVSAGVLAVDLDGDGDDEIIGVTENGELFALRLNGAPFSAQWPIPLGGPASFTATPAAGDLDGDPATLEVIAVDDTGGAHLVQVGRGALSAALTWPGENGDRGATACLGATPGP